MPYAERLPLPVSSYVIDARLYDALPPGPYPYDPGYYGANMPALAGGPGGQPWGRPLPYYPASAYPPQNYALPSHSIWSDPAFQTNSWSPKRPKTIDYTRPTSLSERSSSETRYSKPYPASKKDDPSPDKKAPSENKGTRPISPVDKPVDKKDEASSSENSPFVETPPPSQAKADSASKPSTPADTATETDDSVKTDTSEKKETHAEAQAASTEPSDPNSKENETTQKSGDWPQPESMAETKAEAAETSPPSSDNETAPPSYQRAKRDDVLTGEVFTEAEADSADKGDVENEQNSASTSSGSAQASRSETTEKAETKPNPEKAEPSPKHDTRPVPPYNPNKKDATRPTPIVK
jgi:hypothetical protein